MGIVGVIALGILTYGPKVLRINNTISKSYQNTPEIFVLHENFNETSLMR